MIILVLQLGDGSTKRLCRMQDHTASELKAGSLSLDFGFLPPEQPWLC